MYFAFPLHFPLRNMKALYNQQLIKNHNNVVGEVSMIYSQWTRIDTEPHGRAHGNVCQGLLKTVWSNQERNPGVVTLNTLLQLLHNIPGRARFSVDTN